MLIAVVASVAGFAIDAGSGGGELTTVFAALFVIGCLAAVLAVRQNGVFTAVIQPPLILFVLVPGAYFLMHSDSIQGLKDILINCGYPLIERFPLMFFTSAAVLLIGLARWYYGATNRRAATDTEDAAKARGGTATPGRLSALIGSLVGGRAVAAAATDAPPRRSEQTQRRRAGAAKTGTQRPARGERRGSKPAPRRPRPDETEIIDPVAADRPRRRRPRPDDMPPPERRRRTASAREPRRPAPGDDRRVPYERGEREPRPARGRSRYDGYEGYEVFGGADRYRDGYEPPRQRGNGTGTHHPVSRVRYRGGEDSDDRAERRARRPREYEPDRWEYDI